MDYLVIENANGNVFCNMETKETVDEKLAEGFYDDKHILSPEDFNYWLDEIPNNSVLIIQGAICGVKKNKVDRILYSISEEKMTFSDAAKIRKHKTKRKGFVLHRTYGCDVLLKDKTQSSSPPL